MRGKRPKTRLQRKNATALAKVRALVSLNHAPSAQDSKKISGEKLGAMWRQARQIWLGQDRMRVA